MFIGEFQHVIDEKGRLAVPSKFRKGLSGGAVVTRGLDGCLFIYPMAAWKTFADKVSSLPISLADARATKRRFLGGAMDVRLDKQGRVLLPEYLRNEASLGRDAMVIGLNDHVEVWAKEAWTRYITEVEKQSGDIAEQLRDLGI